MSDMRKNEEHFCLDVEKELLTIGYKRIGYPGGYVSDFRKSTKTDKKKIMKDITLIFANMDYVTVKMDESHRDLETYQKNCIKEQTIEARTAKEIKEAIIEFWGE